MKKEGPNKDKEEIVVAMFVTQAPGQSLEFAQADASLASELSKRLPEMAKEGKQKQKITVVPTAKVNKFKYTNKNWKQMHPAECGKEAQTKRRTLNDWAGCGRQVAPGVLGRHQCDDSLEGWDVDIR